MERYRIDGTIIKHPLICSCGNVVDGDEINDIRMNGLVCTSVSLDGELNELVMLDRISRCCKNPDYTFE